VSHRAARAAAIAAAGMAAFYAVVVGWSGGTEHLADQLRRDWWLVAPITFAFAAQVGVMVELRLRHAQHHALTPASGAASGTSAAGMVACCAHHLVELAPLAGLSGFATTLNDARVPLMLTGLALNIAVIALATRRLRRTPSARGATACAA
jgi:uncharacterized membrane protein YhaH (DUF805 family)